jgi:serine/threonine protein kinase
MDKNKCLKYIENSFTNKYLLLKEIGAGAFGYVYLTEDINNNRKVAAKIEKKSNSSRIEIEYKIYIYLKSKKFNNCPQVFDLLSLSSDHNVMIMQLLGQSLEDKFKSYNYNFKTSTVISIGLNCLNIIENLHNLGYIHRDIKPNNFMTGFDSEENKIFLVDFGLSKKYIAKKRHIKLKCNRSLTGTPRYASLNVHAGIEPSRRDDLESLCYMLIYFLKGKLPWQNLKRSIDIIDNENMENDQKKIEQQNLKEKHIKKILNIKYGSLNKFFLGLHPNFKKMLIYCRELDFDDKPNYDILRKLLIDITLDLEILPTLEWCT